MTVSQSVKTVPVRGRSVRVNSMWNYAGALTSVAAALITTPIYLNALGLDRFGVLAILVAVIAPIGVLNAGVTEATVKYVASYSANGELGLARDAVLASLFINAVVGLVGALACVAAASVFLDLGFKVPRDVAHDAEAAIRLTGAVWLLSQTAGVLRGALEGLRDQRVVVWGDAIQVLLTAVACVILAVRTGTLQGFVRGQLIAIAVMNAVWFLRARHSLKGLAVGYRGARRHLRLTYDYSIWHIVNAAVAFCANFADRYVIGIVMSMASLAAYSIAKRLQSACRMMFYSANQALFPAASAVADVKGAAEGLVLRTTWYVALIAGLGLGWVLVIGPTFLRLWVGDQVAGMAGPVLQILTCHLFFEIASAAGSSYLNAKALTRMTGLNNVATTILTVGLLIPLAKKYGLVGVASSGLIALVVTRAVLHLWMFRRCFRQFASAAVFFKAFYGVSLSCLAAAVLVTPLFSYLAGDRPGIVLFVRACLSVAPLYLAVVFCSIWFILHDGPHLESAFLTMKRTGLRLAVRLRGEKVA